MAPSQRRYHILRGNAASQRPTSQLFVDIESRLIPLDEIHTEHRLWFGWALYWERRPEGIRDTLNEHRFTNVRAFWDIVDGYVHDRHPLYLICHNVNYDLGVMSCFT